jgi:hypothetical protein
MWAQYRTEKVTKDVSPGADPRRNLAIDSIVGALTGATNMIGILMFL